jgi:hypothetical protein
MISIGIRRWVRVMVEKDSRDPTVLIVEDSDFLNELIKGLLA